MRVLRRDGDRLTVTPVTLPVGDIIYLGVAGRLIVTATAIWEIDSNGVEQLAEFPAVLATCVADFRGRVLRYTKTGCEQLIGPHLDGAP